MVGDPAIPTTRTDEMLQKLVAHHPGVAVTRPRSAAHARHVFAALESSHQPDARPERVSKQIASIFAAVLFAELHRSPTSSWMSETLLDSACRNAVDDVQSRTIGSTAFTVVHRV
jgi:hypothetical protein